MAEQSKFVKYIQKYFTGFVAKVTKTLNGEDKAPLYLHKSMLTPKQSIDGKWTSITADNQNVVADVVAMDSPLPLKSRPALQTASGDIPKLGMEMKMNENQVRQLNILVNSNAPDAEVVVELFDDAKRALVGIEEQKEYLFLRGLSSGVALTDSDNVGSGVRVNFGYLAANKGGVPVLWTNAEDATPVTDMQEMISKANAQGKTISTVMIDKVTFNLARKTNEAKDLFAVNIGNFGSTKPLPSYAGFKEFLETELGVQLIIVDRSVKFEKDGVKKTVKAWDEGKVILLTDTNVGHLVWAKVTEDENRSKLVDYRNGEYGTLLSKYVTHKPYGEFTDVQAHQLPVINNVDQIFQLDTKEVQA